MRDSVVADLLEAWVLIGFGSVLVPFLVPFWIPLRFGVVLGNTVYPCLVSPGISSPFCGVGGRGVDGVDAVFPLFLVMLEAYCSGG